MDFDESTCIGKRVTRATIQNNELLECIMRCRCMGALTIHPDRTRITVFRIMEPLVCMCVHVRVRVRVRVCVCECACVRASGCWKALRLYASTKIATIIAVKRHENHRQHWYYVRVCAPAVEPGFRRATAAHTNTNTRAHAHQGWTSRSDSDE
jgi:hypothetical protein